MTTESNIQEKIWFAEYHIRQSRAKPGKAIRRLYPALTDGQVQDLAAYFSGGFDVQVTSYPAVWVDAYAGITSCMHGKGALCERAYRPHGVKIAVLRDAGGLIVARMLVRNGLAFKAYGEKSHVLAIAMHVLGDVEITEDWMQGVDVVQAPIRNSVLHTVSVHLYETIQHHEGCSWGGWYAYTHKYLSTEVLDMRGTGYFRPYIDGRGYQ